MLNAVWAFLLCSGLATGFLRNDTSRVVGEILQSATAAVQTLLTIGGAICFWTGLMNVANKSGLSKAFASCVAPLLRLLFPTLEKNGQAYRYAALNISANLLGIGSAATPLGLKAMDEMKKEKDCPYLCDSMCTLVIFNTVGPSLIPATVVALRSSFGSLQPDIIVGPAFVGGLVAVIVALTSDHIFRKKWGNRR